MKNYAAWMFLLVPCFFACVFVVASENENFGKQLIADPAYYGKFYGGDLYELSPVEAFKEKIQELPLGPSDPLHSSEYLVLGDSFFDQGLDSAPVFNYLQDKLTGGVFYDLPDSEITPVNYLKQAGYKKGAPKIFIWETAERLSLPRALALPGDASAVSVKPAVATPPSRASVLVNDLASVVNFLKPDRSRVEYVIENNFLVTPWRVWLKNKDYQWFGDVDGATPLYSSNPNLLFWNQEVDFHNDNSKIAQIPKAADSIAQEAILLKDQYNLTLVYVMVPDKLSLYYQDVKGPNFYDGYAPFLDKALLDRGVNVVDVYGTFLNYQKLYPNKLLYYSGDIHYNTLGKTLAEQALLKKLKDLQK